MNQFKGISFFNCPVPIEFKGRYFILEQEPTPTLSVILAFEGKPLLEMRQNNPQENPLSEGKVSETGEITVSDKKTGKLLYKIKPGPEIEIVFSKNDGGEIFAKISSENQLKVGKMKREILQFNGETATLGIRDDDSIISGSSRLPSSFFSLFYHRIDG
jgi:hypothetical protein